MHHRCHNYIKDRHVGLGISDGHLQPLPKAEQAFLAPLSICATGPLPGTSSFLPLSGSWGCHHKLPQRHRAGKLKTVTYPLTVPEARSSNSRWFPQAVPSRCSEGGSALGSSAAADNPWCSWACGCITPLSASTVAVLLQ